MAKLPPLLGLILIVNLAFALSGCKDGMMPDSNANLLSLAISAGYLTPDFEESGTVYSVTLAGTQSITVTPTTADDRATVTVNGVNVLSGTTSQPIELSAGETTITIIVTAANGSTTREYAVTVTVTAAGPQLVYVVNHSSNTVTFFNALDGSYLNGTLENSSFATHDTPGTYDTEGVAVNGTAGLVYVTVGTQNTVVFFNAQTGDYAFGTLAASSFTTGGYLFGTLEASSFITGELPYAVAVSD